MTTGSNTLPNMLTPDDLAGILRISKTGVYRLVEKRQIPFFRVGGSLRFAKSDISAYLSGNRIEPVN
jgi:excisionase family DNA binding protein